MRRGGFTLIELLVVIAIIGLLVALLLPTLGRVKKQGKAVVCLTNVRALSQKLSMVLQDQGRMIQGGAHNLDHGTWDYQLLGDNKTTTSSYTNDGRRDALDKLRYCPETEKGMTMVAMSSDLTWNCAGSTGSYGFNGWLYDPNDPKNAYFGSLPKGAAIPQYIKGATTGNRSLIPTLSDANWHDFWPAQTDVAPKSLLVPDDGSFGPSTLKRAALDRHGKAVNVSFLDGHAEKVKVVDLWTLKWSAQWTRSKPEPIK